MARLPHPRFVAFLAIFLVAGLAGMTVLHWHVAIVAGFDLAAVVFLASMVPLWSGGTAERMRRSAAGDDGGRIFRLAVAGIVLAVILFALGMVIVRKAQLGPADLALVIATLLLAWGFVNTVFALHYAHLYYDRRGEGGDRRGLDFPGTELPEFSDFCYFSFVLGMTFQVSDVAIASSHLRRVAMVQGMLAFFYSLGVLALVINVLAGIL